MGNLLKLLARGTKFRAHGLLDMMYTPAELAEELGITREDVYRTLIPAGMPHTKDIRGHIWIHGPVAGAWILSQQRRKKLTLTPDQFLCLHCRVAVTPNPLTITRARSGRYHYLRAACPTCGLTVCKGVRNNGDNGEQNDHTANR